MTLNASTGLLSGTPTSPGTYNFVVRVTVDGYSDVVDVEFEIPVPLNYRIPTGLRWVSRWNPVGSMSEIEYGGSWYVGLSGANVTRTQDGVNWSSAQVAAGISLQELSYGDGVWLAVDYNNKVYRSIDNGASWIMAGTMPGAGRSLLKSGGVWLGLNGTTIYRSVDNGTTWSSVATGATQNLYDMAAGGGVVVAVGLGGQIVSSTDGGINWVNRASETTSSIASIAYGNGRFLAVGSYNLILTSFDGVTWQLIPAVRGSSGVAFGNGMFVRDNGDVSADGAVWTTPISTTYDFGSDDMTVYGASGWIAVDSASISQTVGGAVPGASVSNVQGTIGQGFQSQISASGATIYKAWQLPPGLSVNTMTGVISGTPTTAGTYQIIIQAGNANGYGSYTTAQIAIGN
jgi:hypothetical protein